MVREYEIQHSISEGVAKVLRGEVGVAQNALRVGQRRGVKFDVVRKADDHVDVEASSTLPLPDKELLNIEEPEIDPTVIKKSEAPKAGHCVGCHDPFTEHESETLVGFACGHVFHLSHLLAFDNDRPQTPPMMELDENGEWKAMHSVGAKVTHARLLRDKIRDGCPVCRATLVGLE